MGDNNTQAHRYQSPSRSVFKWELLMSSFYFSNMNKAIIEILKYVYSCFLVFWGQIPISANVGSNNIYLKFWLILYLVTSGKDCNHLHFPQQSKKNGLFIVTDMDCYHLYFCQIDGWAILSAYFNLLFPWHLGKFSIFSNVYWELVFPLQWIAWAYHLPGFLKNCVPICLHEIYFVGIFTC